MMSNYTPGPWVVQETNFAQQKNVYAQTDKPPIATVYGSTGENEANARLIAAAPDLLAALKECITAVDVTMYGMAIHNARAAIAKATGDQP